MKTHPPSPLDTVHQFQRDVRDRYTLSQGAMHYSVLKHYSRLTRRRFPVPSVSVGGRTTDIGRGLLEPNIMYLPLASYKDPKPALKAKLDDAMLRVGQSITEFTAIINDVSTASEGVFTRTDAKSVIETFVAAALQIASSMEYVLTVENEPVQPLAMGNYIPVVKLRDSNPLYRAVKATPRMQTYVDPTVSFGKEIAENIRSHGSPVAMGHPMPVLPPSLILAMTRLMNKQNGFQGPATVRGALSVSRSAFKLPPLINAAPMEIHLGILDTSAAAEQEYQHPYSVQLSEMGVAYHPV